MNNFTALEYDKILQMLSDNAVSESVKARCLTLAPSLSENEVKSRLDETSQAKEIIGRAGTPPLPSMRELQRALGMIDADAMLLPEQITHVSSFLVSCRRMKAYLKRADPDGAGVAGYGGAVNGLSELSGELDRCIINGGIDDRASPALADIRRRAAIASDQIRSRLEALMRKNKDWFSESFISMRNGRYTLPVKREHRSEVAGTLMGISQSGGTCFIEPESVGKLRAEISELQIEEDNEIRRILYTLTALISENLAAVRLNIEAMEALDFIFAKAKLSLAMKAEAAEVNPGRDLIIKGARHPLLDREKAVPLDFGLGNGVNGAVITGPNTGGKTVALKTIGLLSLMIQSGLHITADGGSSFPMRNLVLCDIGDGQSITENLSTFSAHMTNIIAILKQANRDSLVLLDELGSGTDPAEGMGLAIAILEELLSKECLFTATTHYPEVKMYAAERQGIVNARMAFDKESLLPLYRLEMGEAGESCAIYIAERLGLPRHMLDTARRAAYVSGCAENNFPVGVESGHAAGAGQGAPQIKRADEKQKTEPLCEKFNIGDSVLVYPRKETGIVYARTNKKGEVGVQVKGEKKLINHKRIKLQVPASELYPDDYDFSIVFDSVKNRKARHLMEKRHEAGNVVIINEGEQK